MKTHVLSLFLACAILSAALAGCGRADNTPAPALPDVTDPAGSPETETGGGILLPEIEFPPETEPAPAVTEKPASAVTSADAVTSAAVGTPADIETPEVSDEYFPDVNTEKSASLLEELPKLGLDGDDPRLQYVRAFVTADTALLEQTCGVEAGMYAPYRTLDLAAWFAWIDSAEGHDQLKFAFYPVHTDVEAFRVNAWNEGFVYEGPLGAYLSRPRPDSSFGEAAKAVSGLLTGYMPPILPTTDDMDEDTRFWLTCYIFHKLGSEYNGVEENYRLYAKTHFGIDDFTPEEVHVKFTCAHGGSVQLLDIIGSEERNGETAVTVQFYADPSRTVKSHVFEYTVKKADGDWIFTGCREILHAKYDAMRMVW